MKKNSKEATRICAHTDNKKCKFMKDAETNKPCNCDGTDTVCIGYHVED